MSTATRTQRRYDHRLKELVRATRSIDVALESGVPRSTAYGWLSSSNADVVTLDVLDKDVAELQREVVLLRRGNARLIVLLRLIVTVMKVAGFSLARLRIPEERDKLRVLRAIEQARVHFAANSPASHRTADSPEARRLLHPAAQHVLATLGIPGTHS